MVECHHISGQGFGFHILDNILPVHQPHSLGLPRAGQLKVPPKFQWLCIPETCLGQEKEVGGKERGEQFYFWYTVS